MSMRISSLTATLLLAGCGQTGGKGEQAVPAEKIRCALDGATGLALDCSLERATEDGRQLFVVRHPDGKFRRLSANADGQNLLAADGADQSQSALKGDRWEVILGDDRYVIPVKPDVPKP